MDRPSTTQQTPDAARLFIAVPLPPEVREALGRLSRNLQKGFQFTRCRPAWSDPDAIHLTLAFLGRKPRAMIAPLGRALHQAMAGFAPLMIEIKGLGVFPNWQRPRVLWTGMRERTHQLAALHDAVEHALAPFDYEPEEREFQPHLTLARFKNLSGVGAAQPIVLAHKDFRLAGFEARECVLFESQLHASGARHFALESFIFPKEPTYGKQAEP